MSFVYLSFYLSLFICFATCQDYNAPYEGFMRAFPHANISDLLSLDPPVTTQTYLYNPPAFACPTLQPPPDTADVNNLRPGNIKVLMAMGDSITAGMSIFDSWITSLNEYRGTSFSIGADAAFTLPTFLSKSSGFIATGASTGDSRDHIGNGFNAAVSGAKAKDMLLQAEWLVQKLLASNVDMNNDWKLLTIWIGSNNLCDVCNNEADNNAKNYENNLVAALQYLYDRVPRVFVNLIAPLDVATLWNIEGVSCTTIHAIACPCAGSFFKSQRDKVTAAARGFASSSYTIASKFKKTDFAVVVQPFLLETKITERGLLSAGDCFHPSSKGHAVGAVALWNNMLTPVATKKKSWNDADQPICPSDADKFFTY